MGPLLFLLYINDLPSISNQLYFTLFADDTNAFISAPSADVAANIMNHELIKLNSWLVANRLKLNIEKTKYIIFSASNRITMNTQVKLNNNPIEKVNYATFLGVILDRNLRWDRHISHVRAKVSRSIGIFIRLAKIFPQSTTRTLYYTLVHPHLTYCIEVWGGAAQVHLLPLFKLQKKIIRLITSSHRLDHTTPLFNQLEILTLKQLYYFHVLLFMHKFCNNLLPPIFNSMFTLTPAGAYHLRRPPPLTVHFLGLWLLGVHCLILAPNCIMNIIHSVFFS